jgi:hypothetical protein
MKRLMDEVIFENLGREAKALGFLFCGVMPYGINGRHKLILQYMNNLGINYDLIRPYSPKAVEILDYIRVEERGDFRNNGAIYRSRSAA